MKNSELEGFIRPNVVIKALKTLKERGNKFYQDVEINEDFMKKQESDPQDMEVDQSTDDESLTQKIEKQLDEDWEQDEKSKEEERHSKNISDSEDEDDNILKSVKVHQSKQSSNTFLIPDDMANEVIVNNENSSITKNFGEEKGSIKIAPGEGKIPTNLLREQHFDVRAFPKHHPNGQYGFHHTRKHKLTAQMYFDQRLMNHDERFSRDPCYLFMACYYLERQSIERQIDISGNIS